MKKQIRLFNLLIIIALFMGACNLPQDNQGEEASLTAAAQTVEALLSATPAVTSTFTLTPAATLTSIPLPVSSNTPVASATPNCNAAQFVADVTIPDGTVMAPGQAFVKKWRIKNIGTCAWSGYTLIFDSGDSMNGPATKAISALNPGQEVDLEVNLTAPSAAGNYRGYWRIVTNGNVLVPVVDGYQGRSFYVDIKVATATNTSAPAFAVTSVTFTNTGGCGGFTATANVSVNGPGTVNLHWVRSDGATPAVPPALVFTAAGTQSVNISWNTTATGTNWFDIYVDTPNNQQFGRASFICP
jgi:Ig-like domain from next to BRCA1 gene